MNTRPKAQKRFERAQNLWLINLILFAGVVAALLLAENTFFALVFGGIGLVLALSGYQLSRLLTKQVRQTLVNFQRETKRLKATEQRTQAIYKLATTLSSSLRYDAVLEAVQDLGSLALRDPDPSKRLVSVAFLFSTQDNLLHVANSRRLTLADERKAIDGQKGLIAKALKSAVPVFGARANDDEELRYFVGFNNVQSLVAVPLIGGFQNYGVVVFGSTEVDGFDPATGDLLAALGTQATVAFQNAVLVESILSEKERIVQVEEDARKKLARDLHDGPTQTIAVIEMRLTIIERLLRNKKLEQIQQELTKLGELAKQTTKQMRQMLFNLRPLVLENQGLVAAIHELSAKMKDTYNLNIVVEANPDAEKYLDDKAQGALFYVIEEAINNARKHAQAERITVRLHQHNHHCVIEIEDNGVGFNVDEIVNSEYHKRGSLGMVSMRERVELVDGKLNLQSKVGKGTKITIHIAIADDLLSGKLKPSTQKHPPEKQLLAPTETRFAAQIAPETDELSGWEDLLKSIKEQ